MVAILRTSAGRDPHDRALHDLVGELSTRSGDFARRWSSHNVRIHGTTEEVPRERFQREERMALNSLASRPYRSLVLSTAPTPRLRPLPSAQLQVERRPLQVYTRIVGGRP